MFLARLRFKARGRKRRVNTDKIILEAFVGALAKRKFTPEEFFKAILPPDSQTVSVEAFVESIMVKKLLETEVQALRLVSILCENQSDSISLLNLKKALVAFSMPLTDPVVGSSNPIKIEQYSVIKVHDLLKRRTISPSDLFNAIDTGGDMQLSCSEIKEFVASIGQGSVSDNDLRIFVNFLDIDRSGLVSKAEFLQQFRMLDGIY